MKSDPEMDKKTEDLINTESFLETLFEDISSGRSLLEICQTDGLRYSRIYRWIALDPDKKMHYDKAVEARTEIMCQSLLDELKAISLSDLRQAYDDRGHLKTMRDMPPEIAKVIAGVEVFEEFDGSGKQREYIGDTKKIKLWDKLRAIELLGKQMKLFIDRVEHSGKVSLEDLVNKSMKSPESKQI